MQLLEARRRVKRKKVLPQWWRDVVAKAPTPTLQDFGAGNWNQKIEEWQSCLMPSHALAWLECECMLREGLARAK